MPPTHEIDISTLGYASFSMNDYLRPHSGAEFLIR